MREALQSSKKEQDRLAAECEKTKQELAEERFQMEVKSAEYERLRTETASSASALDEIKRLQTKVSEERIAGDAKLAEEKEKAAEQVGELRVELDTLSSEFAKA